MSLRTTRCKHCKGKLTPERAGQSVHLECIEAWAFENMAKKERAQAKAVKRSDAADTKARKEKLKTRSDWMKEAQKAFNQFIRLRDEIAGYPCVSSGRPLDWSGNQVDAGHLRSVGSAPQCRFNEDNCHAQSKHDNQFLSGNAVEYRKRLIERIGLERVEAVEADNEPKKYTIDDLLHIRDTYRQKLKELKKTR